MGVIIFSFFSYTHSFLHPGGHLKDKIKINYKKRALKSLLLEKQLKRVNSEGLQKQDLRLFARRLDSSLMCQASVQTRVRSDECLL